MSRPGNMDNDKGRQARRYAMSLVNLVSGGLDSTLVGVMAQEMGIEAFPLFIDYGQRAATREWETCARVHSQLNLHKPVRLDLSGFGRVIASGLTNSSLDIKEHAFTPGRNLMFLLMGSAYAFQLGASTIAIGLLSEHFSLFPDQTSHFIQQAESAINAALGRLIKIVLPLSDFCKTDVVRLAHEKGISNTYSCHAGTEQPCGQCISCLEFGKPIGG
jgi:7-cyano-7-deazaguanine synthase